MGKWKKGLVKDVVIKGFLYLCPANIHINIHKRW